MRRGWAVAVGALMLVACGGQNGPTQPPSATHLSFTVQPSNTAAGAAITPAVQVAVQDAQGNTVTTATTSITVAIGTNPASGTLAGAAGAAATNGVAAVGSQGRRVGGDG